MNTRQKIEYEVFVLCLADMHGGVDKSRPVAVFDELQKLQDYYSSQLADEPYTDEPSMDSYGNTHSWHKVFKKGSALEWFNPASSLDPAQTYECIFGGVFSDWVDNLDFNVPFNPID